MKRRNLLKLGFASLGTLALTRDAQALKYYPMPSEKKYAVLYSTWCGSSRDAAVWISEGMAGIADVFDVRENPDLKGYEHIILGGSIRSGVTSQQLQDYIKQNKEWLKDKIRGLFIVCGNMRQPIGPEQIKTLIDEHLAKICEVSKVPSKIFLGRITKSLMDSQTAKTMAQMEDYDNLKRPECMAFGKDVLAAINKK
jgi:menaquinone-dependent protoporphyrinogen IX oxidase